MRSYDYPCVCGHAELAKRRPQISRRDGAAVLFSTRYQGVAIYRLGGVSKNVVVRERGNAFDLLIGRVYSPVYLSADVPEHILQQRFEELNKHDITAYNGNFVWIKYRRLGNDTVCFTLTTDKFGTRMMLYLIHDGSLFFSTHLSGIKYLLNGELPGLCEESVIHHYHFGFTANDRTLIDGLYKLPPGSKLMLENSDIKIEKYFTLSQLYTPDDYATIAETRIARRIDRTLAESIALRSPDRRRIALALSGGVDSGYILKHALELGSEVSSYNLGYDGHYSENDRIRSIEKELKIKVKRIITTPDEIINQVELGNQIGSEPVRFNDAAMMIVSQAAASDGFRHLWDGDGADRLFFGMNRHLQYLKLISWYEKLKDFKLIKPLLIALRMLPPGTARKVFILFNNWRRGIPPYPERKLGPDASYHAGIENFLFNLAIRRYWDAFQVEFETDDPVLYFSFQSLQMCPEMFFYPPAELQAFSGMSPVSPFWDDRMVNVALSIPVHLKVKKGQTKYILRRAAALNGMPSYWEMPKIGLQSAFRFCMKSMVGRNWREDLRCSLRGSDEMEIIKNHLKGEKVNKDRLLVLHLWRKMQKDIN